MNNEMEETLFTFLNECQIKCNNQQREVANEFKKKTN